jgi:hypothetical protein
MLPSSASISVASKEQLRPLRLAIVCAEPPAVREPEATFGLQDKNKHLQAGEPQANGALRFACEIGVRRHPQTGAPDFAGPYVHGPLGERFLYLSLQDLRTGSWIRRIKVMLAGISWELIEAASALPDVWLAARVIGTQGARARFEGDGWKAQP